MHSWLDQLRQSPCAKINIKINIYNFILFWSNLFFLYSILFSCFIEIFSYVLFYSFVLLFILFYYLYSAPMCYFYFILLYSAPFYSFVFRCAFIYSNSFFFQIGSSLLYYVKCILFCSDLFCRFYSTLLSYCTLFYTILLFSILLQLHFLFYSTLFCYTLIYCIVFSVLICITFILLILFCSPLSNLIYSTCLFYCALIIFDFILF